MGDLTKVYVGIGIVAALLCALILGAFTISESLSIASREARQSGASQCAAAVATATQKAQDAERRAMSAALDKAANRVSDLEKELRSKSDEADTKSKQLSDLLSSLKDMKTEVPADIVKHLDRNAYGLKGS